MAVLPRRRDPALRAAGAARLSGPHGDLCFGCGTANLFGLQLELTRSESGEVSGRFFVKQDHQGPTGAAHAGVLAAALEEALSVAAGAPLSGFTVSLVAPAPVGTFVCVRASGASATASNEEGDILASASALAAPPAHARPSADLDN